MASRPKLLIRSGLKIIVLFKFCENLYWEIIDLGFIPSCVSKSVSTMPDSRMPLYHC